MKNTKIVVLVIAVLVLAMLACGGGSATPSSSKEATPTSGGTTSGGDKPVPTKEATPETSGKEDNLTLSNLAEGLTNLKSYKAQMVVKFDGKDDKGQAVKGSMDMIEEFIEEPRAQRVVIAIKGFEQEQASQSGNMEMVNIGQEAYIIFEDQDGKRSCISTIITDTSSNAIFTPETMGGVNDAKYVKTETVNGVQAKRYSWQQNSIVGFGFDNAKGEIWVAVDGGYAVKYTAEASGKGSIFGGTSDTEGTITIEYNLLEVNQSFKIEPPKDCESAAADVPLMADAADKSVLGDLVTYSSPSAFADVVQFYKDEMVNQGWTLSGDPTEMEGLAMLDFTKDERKASVMISEDKDKNVTSVMINVTKE